MTRVDIELSEFRMRGVSRFEAEVLRLLSCILQRAPAEHVLALVQSRAERPPCLSRNCIDLLVDHLRKGVVGLLAHQGAWQKNRHLRGGKVVSGRLWERFDPSDLGMFFSRHSLSFLMWLRASDPVKSIFRPRTEAVQITFGDRYLIFLAYEALRNTEIGGALLAQPIIAGNPLVQLTFPEDFHNQSLPVASFHELAAPQNAWLLETQQHSLRLRWRAVERMKRSVTQAAEMTGIGRTQEAVLDGFLTAIEQAERKDLARFCLQALYDLLWTRPLATDWIANLNVTDLRAIDRSHAYQAAATFLRRVPTFHRWTEDARAVSYLDREEYVAAQLWLTEWETWQGDSLVTTAADLIRQLDPLRVMGSGSPTSEGG